MRDRAGEIAAWLAYSLGAVLMGGAALETFVYIPNWLHDMPRSLETTRTFLAVRNPGHFFQIVAPLLIVVTLAGIALSWRRRRVRWALLGGLALMVIAEALTFVLVYPNFGVLLANDVAQRPMHELEAAARALIIYGFWVRLPLMALAVFGLYLYAARASTVESAMPRSIRDA